jgi:HAD superfamily hydrolase (TIGR01509 family)
MYEAVIFDCDGVLINSEAIHIDVCTEVFAEHGLHLTRDELIETFLGQATETFQGILRRLCDERNIPPLPANIFDLCHQKFKESCEDKLSATPGVHGALCKLFHKRAIATNSKSEEATKKLTHTGLRAHFHPHIYTRDMVNKGKPAPDIYLHAANALGALPENCIVIEDSELGVTAAVAAGMTVIGYTGGGHCPEGHDQKLRQAGAAEIITHMSQLQDTITQMEARKRAISLNSTPKP